MVRLDVYVSDDCWSCEETRRIIKEMRDHFPDVAIELLDGEPESWPDDVFAVPTYVLDGRIISLGNPQRHTLQRQLAAARSLDLVR